jgi:metal-responsive CopG/Arc/MetJ family transcriptional regulator
MPKIKIDDELMNKIKRCAKLAGYSSAEEFILHALEKQMAQLDDGDSEEEVKKKLRGLGYIS